MDGKRAFAKRGRGSIYPYHTPDAQKIPRRDWYGPNLRYVIDYKPVEPDSFTGEDQPAVRITVDDPFVDTKVIKDVPTYKEYKAAVYAENDVGMAVVGPEWSTGRSGETAPSAAPKNFELESKDGPSAATFRWDAIDATTVNGELKGYKTSQNSIFGFKA
uniref:Uncharacterized protein n=1 Tax=Romanomermis culicivorax TaxID=13658 RepID=A0A915IH62_ROMCU